MEWTYSEGTDCPFDESICRNNTSVHFNTGYLNSHSHFGINAPASDRIEYRKTMSCAPLTTKGYVEGPEDAAQWGFYWWYNDGENIGDPLILKYYYGESLFDRTNYTIVMSNNSLSSIGSYTQDYLNYVLSSHWSMQDEEGSSTFLPIPALNRTDADVTLLFLATDVEYMQPVRDPWFEAQKEFLEFDDDFENHMFYPTHPVSVLGCTEQHQICNPAVQDASGSPHGHCTALTGLWPMLNTGADEISLSERQRTVFNRIIVNAATYNTLGRAGLRMGGTAMLANQHVDRTLGDGLPANQWILELNNWFGTILTSLQLSTIQFVTGPGDAKYNKYVRPAIAEQQWMCGGQITRRDDYFSFNMLGLCIILVVGSVIVLVNLALPFVWKRVQRKRAVSGRYSGHSEWLLSGTLQLQRMTVEGKGLAKWTNTARSNPGAEAS